MAERGETHIENYKTLLKLADQTVFFQLFSNINKLHDELKINEKEIKELSKTDISEYNPFTIAYQIEYYLSHPVFERLYTFISTLFSDIPKITSYYDQLTFLYKKADKFIKDNPELSLIGKCLYKIIDNNKELTYQNFFDQSSGVLNIRGFFYNVRPLSFLAMRKKYNVGLLILDMDQFKKTFKEFPLLEREKIIRLVADKIKTHIRRSDLIARYGDDKLILYLSDIREEHFEEFIKKIKMSVESDKYLNMKITISIGGVQSYITGSPIKKIDSLFRSAEEALQLAKSSKESKIIISKIIKT